MTTHQKGSPCLLFVVFGLCILVGGFLVLKFIIEKSLHRADCIELTEHLKRWAEAGSPQGAELVTFLKGRRPAIVVSNRVFSIEGTNYATQFAVTNLHSNRRGILFVTTNQILIWVSAAGESEIQSLTPRQR